VGVRTFLRKHRNFRNLGVSARSAVGTGDAAACPHAVPLELGIQPHLLGNILGQNLGKSDQDLGPYYMS